MRFFFVFLICSFSQLFYGSLGDYIDLDINTALSDNINLISTINGGKVSGVLNIGNYLYFTHSDNRVSICNIDSLNYDSSKYRYYDFNCTFTSMCVKDNYIILANKTDGIRIYEALTPYNPVLVKQISDRFYSKIIVKGNLLYAFATDNTISVFDISNPISPIKLTTALARISAYSFHVNEDSLICCVSVDDSSASLFKFTGSSIDSISVINLKFAPYASCINDNDLFIGSYSINNVYKYNLANPSLPSLSDSISASSVRKIWVDDDLLIVNHFSQYSFYNYPPSPDFNLLGTYDYKILNDNWKRIGDMLITGGYDFLQIIDITDPTNPSISDSMNFGRLKWLNSYSKVDSSIIYSNLELKQAKILYDTTVITHFINNYEYYNIIADDSQLFCMNYGTMHLFREDSAGLFTIADTFTFNQSCNEAHIFNGIIAIPDRDTLVVRDFQGSSWGTGVIYDVHERITYMSHDSANNRLFISRYSTNSLIISLSDDGHIIDTVKMGREYISTAISDTIFAGILASFGRSIDLAIIDSLNNFTLITNLSTSVGVEDLYLKNNLLILITDDNILLALDIADPYSPEILGYYQLSSYFYGKVSFDPIYNNRIYISDDGTLKFLEINLSAGQQGKENRIDKHIPGSYLLMPGTEMRIPVNPALNTDISIYDINGRLQKKLNELNENTITVKASDFTSGTYYIKFLNEYESPSTVKLIVL